MAEDIVERLRVVSDKAFGPDGFPLLTVAANEIEHLSTQLATEHALGFKAGIEAAKEAIAAVTLPAPVDDDWPEDEDVVGALVKGVSLADEAVKAITSLPTPPSPLAEILEAMRPIAKRVAEIDEGSAFVWGAATTVDIGRLRAIAAVFTKFGGKTND